MRHLITAAGAGLTFHHRTLSMLHIVGDECRAHETCSLHLDAIATRAACAGVRNAFREARTLNLITLQKRRPPCAPFLTDLIRIISIEWKLWLRNMEDTELHSA